MQTFLITENADTYYAFKRYAGATACMALQWIETPRFFSTRRNKRHYARNYMLKFYDHVITSIEKQALGTAAYPEALRQSVVFVDALHPDFDNGFNLELLSDAMPYHPYQRALSMLIMAMPEVHWIFLVRQKPPVKWAQHHCLVFPDELSSAFSHCPHGYLPLFDPLELRNDIRKIANNGNGQTNNLNIPIRSQLAASLDDEDSYAYMNAYTAYRFGYCSWAITTWELMKAVFQAGGEKLYVIFEDLYLSFADQPSGPEDGEDTAALNKLFPKKSDRSISSLRFRDTLLENFTKATKRVLVTVGHKTLKKYDDRWQKNQAYLKEKYQKTHIILYKPFSGIFDLWQQAKLWRSKENLPRYADGFEWPIADYTEIDGTGTHSAPGRLLHIAKTLLLRAERILRSTASVPDAIHASLLALEAKEILASRTPTTALEALAVQHTAEITAESMFYGIEYNLNVKDRFKEIEREVNAISQWFNDEGKVKSALNARLTIIENLAMRFRELNQFEEEQDCLAEARKLRFAFWRKQKPWRILAAPAMFYVELSVRSVKWLMMLVMGWVLLFSSVYYWANGFEDFLVAMSAATAFFFTLEPVEGWQAVSICGSTIWWRFILAFQGFLSFFNLSLLLAIWFSKLSRR